MASHAPLSSGNRLTWETPDVLFMELDREFHFWVDCAASSSNAKCQRYISEERDFFKTELPTEGNLWCNPPYDRKLIKWVGRLHDHVKHTGQTAVMLIPARTATQWFHKYCYNKPGVELRFLKGRLKFSNSETPAAFPSLIVVFRGDLMNDKD